jgi:hypothetical protein
MSIIPAGKRREQVAQGPLKNQSVLESALFKKFGQGAGTLLDEEERATPSSDLQQTMGDSQSRLNMQDNIPGADAGQQPQPQQPQQGMSGSSPASQFLGPDPDAQGQADPNQLYMAERQKIRGFIGNDFGMNLISGGDGTFTIKITPPGNVPVQNPTGFMDALLQHIGGASVTEENTPAISDSGGALMLKYRPSGAGPEKITKGKGGRRR